MCYKRKRLHTLIAPFQGFFKALQLRVTAGISLWGRWRQGALRRLKANIDLLKEKPLYYKFCGWLKTYKFHQWSTIITEDYSFPALKLSTHPCSPFFCPQLRIISYLHQFFFQKQKSLMTYQHHMNEWNAHIRQYTYVRFHSYFLLGFLPSATWYIISLS